MTIPTYDALMLPVLRLCAERTWLSRELVAQMAQELGLTEEERERRLPSGGETVFNNRVHWAKTYLKKAGLLEQPQRAVVRATQRGRDVLAGQPAQINLKFLQQFPEFRAFTTGPKQPDAVPVATIEAVPTAPTDTPEEQIETASKALDAALRDALLARILECSPAFFEKLIIDLMLAMGYGGSRADAGEQLGKSGDGGVDGVIREDRLGLDRIYLQAKRYQPGNSVGSETIQAFIGALVGKGAHKGVLITTSSFTKAALQAAGQAGAMRLVLIDGEALTQHMLRFNVGARIARSIDIKRVDADYFDDGETE